MTSLKTVEERMLPVEEIELSYRNPRQDFSKEDLRDLAESLRIHGQIQPIVVRRKGDKYELVVGERRVRAAIYNDIPKLRAEVVDLTDAEADARRLLENIQRKDFEVWEKVNGLEAYWETYLRMQPDQESTRVERANGQGVDLHNNNKYDRLSEVIGVPAPTIRTWYHVANETNLSSARSTYVRKLPLTILQLLAPLPSDVQERLAKVMVEKKLIREEARSLIKLYIKNPEAELNRLSQMAKLKAESVWIKLPKERANEIKKEYTKFEKNLEIRDRRTIRHELELKKKKDEERKRIQELKRSNSKLPSSENPISVAVELTKDFLAEKEGMTTADDQYSQITTAYASGILTKGEADVALELWKQNPKWNLEFVIKEARVTFLEEEAKRRPQPVYLLVEPNLNSRIRVYAETKQTDFKGAIYTLLDYALDQLGFKGTGV